MDPQRGIWHGLSGPQFQQLANDLRQPPRTHLPLTKAHESLRAEYAHRIAAMLAHNDVRGALWFADLWAYCDQAAQGEKLRAHRDGFSTPEEFAKPQRHASDVPERQQPASHPTRRQATPAR